MCFSNTEPPQRRSAVVNGLCSGLVAPTWEVGEGRTGRNHDGKQGEEPREVSVRLVQGKRVLEGGCSAGQAFPVLPPAGASGLPQQQLRWLSRPWHRQRGWTTGLWWLFLLWQAAGHVPAALGSA